MEGPLGCVGFVGRGAVLRIGGRNEEGRRSALCIRGWWGATIILAGVSNDNHDGRW